MEGVNYVQEFGAVEAQVIRKFPNGFCVVRFVSERGNWLDVYMATVVAASFAADLTKLCVADSEGE